MKIALGIATGWDRQINGLSMELKVCADNKTGFYCIAGLRLNGKQQAITLKQPLKLTSGNNISFLAHIR